MDEGILALMFASASPAVVLADGVVFCSPFADYHGRDRVGRLVPPIGRVLEKPELVCRYEGERDRMTIVEASVAGLSARAALREQLDDAERVREATLWLRPYAQLRDAMRIMHTLMTGT